LVSRLIENPREPVQS